MRKPILAAVLVTFTTFFYSTLYSDEGEHGSVSILKRSLQASPDTLDPHTALGIHPLAVLRDLFDALVNVGGDNSPIPGVAERWEISKDGKNYTFYLRDNAKWSDGSQVTAQDFVYSWQRCVNPYTASPKATLFDIVKNASEIIRGELPPEQLGVEAIDKTTLKVELKSPYPYFLNMLSHNVFFPLPAHLLESKGRNFAKPKVLISNGAFTLDAWRPQSDIILKKNPHYWQSDKVKLDYVHFIPIEDQSALIKLYRTNDIDVSYIIPDSQYKFVQENFPAEFKTGPHLCTYGFGFNVLHAPFKDRPLLRKALSMVIDRNQIVSRVTKAGERPAYSWINSSVNEIKPLNPDYASWSQAERTAKAKEYFKDAGYGPQNKLQVQLRYDTNENHKKIAIAISSMWKKLGVQTQLINEELKVFLQNRRLRQVTQAFRNVWTHDYYDPFSFLVMFGGDSSFNTTGYNNPKFDDLIKQGYETADKVERRKLFLQATKIAQDANVVIPIYDNVIKRLVKPWVVGYHNNSLDILYSKDISIDTAKKAELTNTQQ
jgi:oligopeptide transport system substrate-binding protein